MATTTSDPLTAFISGPLDVSQTYFSKHYIPRINTAIASGHNFIIGPVSGVDTLAREYLLSQSISPSRIKIYMARFEIDCHRDFIANLRSSLGPKAVVEAKTADAGEVMSTWDRDAAMTRDSDYDILRFRTEAETKQLYGDRWRPRVSNTERNWRRRKGELGMEESNVKYVRHISAEDAKAAKAEDSVETCDGTCDGHLGGDNGL